MDCAEQNGFIFAYQIRQHYDAGLSRVYLLKQEDGKQFAVKDDINPESNYSFSIAAYNKAGLGEYSPILTVTTPAEVC